MNTHGMTAVLAHELTLHGRHLGDFALEACMTEEAFVEALQGRRYLAPSIRLELSEILGVSLPAMDGAGIA